MSRIVLVTGGGKGIGAAITSSFLDQGCEVVLVSRTRETLEKAMHDFSMPGFRLHGHTVDVSDHEQVKALAEKLTGSLPRLDVLVNNVGGFYFSNILDQSENQWREMVGTNLDSVYYMVRHLYPLIKRSRHGRIINIAAAYAGANAGHNDFGGFAALKTAVLSMSKSLSLECAGDGVTVNVVSPGMIDTGAYGAGTIEKYNKLIPMGRFGKPEEVARAVSFFAEEENSYITGAEIVVAGGWSGETGG